MAERADSGGGPQLERETSVRFLLAVEPGHVEAAHAVLQAPRWRDELLDVGPSDAVVGLQVTSAVHDVESAVLRVISGLRAADIRVTGYTVLDLVTDPPDAWLDTQLDGWQREHNRGPWRRRLSALAGVPVLERLLGRVDEPTAGRDRRWVCTFAASRVAFTTPTAAVWERLLDAAERWADRGVDRHTVASAINAVGHLLPMLSPDLAPAIGEGPLPRLAAGPPGAVSDAAVSALGWLPAPRSPEAVEVLLARADRYADRTDPDSGVRASDVARALGRAPTSAEVVATLHRLTEHGYHEARAAAVEAIVRVQGVEVARPSWERLLESRSSMDRWAAEQLLVRYGDHRDVPAAAAALGRLLRSRATIGYDPPREVPLLRFLLRYPDDPDAVEAVASVRRRWSRLSENVRRRVAQQLPEVRS